MAQKKSSGKATARKKSAAPASNRQNGRKGADIQKNSEDRERRRALWSQIVPYILIVAAIFLVICFFTGSGDEPGVVMKAIYNLLTGVFGGAAFVIPAFLVFAAIAQLLDRGADIIGMRTAFAVTSAVLVSVLLEIISPVGSFKVGEMYTRGSSLSGGGVVGGLIGEGFLFCFKAAGSCVIVISALILSVLLCAGLTPKYLFVYFSYKIKEAKARRAEAAEDADESDGKPRRGRRAADNFRDPDDIGTGFTVDETTGEVYDEIAPEDDCAPDTSSEVYIPDSGKGRRHHFDTDVPLDDEYPAETEANGEAEETEEEKRERLNGVIYEEVMRRAKETKSRAELEAEKALFADGDSSQGAYPQSAAGDALLGAGDAAASADPEGAELIDRIADAYLGKGSGESGDGAQPLSVQRESISERPVRVTQVPMEIPKPEYKFPPIDLLADVGPQKNDNIREELHDNAAKLVNVLASFNVKTRIVGVSRGPTITRYELLPEAGIRVRSIANLVDDIALNLATGGVRIEAPIPGKAAVGIEVPNKQPETVYLRSLISTDEFKNSKSRITTCLGRDVAGEPIIMDIKKMPHLLIAGATGMGKSVCINCLLVSMLYKAKPDEVKLILIDPKKVEFGIYNGLPHLLVPVVSDPKKAAGSLTWAVNEMERRFSLIESVGVRDIENYNEITKNDPEKEYMPQIVIVIDELADLMSTAPDDVETSIARLAAKARAAGMHLVIGTQRPSVDVITGVIKANIPSRIAFTVASQVDSRTIIDKSGAENLIGRGDMLYNPVGCSKPMRVQGAFVSEKEVDAVVSYIKKNDTVGGAEYSDDVMKQIEAEAAMCGVKKSGGGAMASAGGDGEADPLMDQALEVAFESGKISTSLLQRRLSVGYGRAAKIIDKMEQLGYVSAPDGQKPRELLITKQEYMERCAKGGEEE